MNTIVIAGAGQAGYQTAISLRQEGFSGSITLIGDEAPYQRPPLSKAYMLGKLPVQALEFRAAAYFEQQRINRIEASIIGLDRRGRDVKLRSGTTVQYDHLVLATGARNRVPDVPGVYLDGVYGIRTLADADALASRLTNVTRAVVIGAGFIGLEFAAVASARGISIDVIEIGDRPMSRAVSVPTANLFNRFHQEWGVRIHYRESLDQILGTKDRKVVGVQTKSGRQIQAELVVYGIGVVPNTKLAEESGLTVDNGVCVDEFLKTTDDSISAIGDVANFKSPWSVYPVRLESVQNAVDQARTVAARLAGKTPVAYAAVPWFWTDQRDMKLQIAGLSALHDEAIRLPIKEKSSQTVLCFSRGRLIAAESTNSPADHMAARALLHRRTPLSPEQARATTFDLRKYEAATRSNP